MPINREGRDQPTPPQPPKEGTRWWEYAFEPMRRFGAALSIMETATPEERLKLSEQRANFPLPVFDIPEKPLDPEALRGMWESLAPGGEQRERFEELPLGAQLAFEAPAWAILPSFLGLFRKARALPTAARIPAQIVTAPIAGLEKAVEWPISKAITKITKLLPQRTVTRPNASYEQLTKIHDTALNGSFINPTSAPNLSFKNGILISLGKL